MKFLLIAVAFAMFVSVQARSDTRKEKVRALAKKCIAETGVEIAVLRKLRSGDYSMNNKKLNSFVFCMMKKTGVMNEAGVFNKKVALSMVPDNVKDAASKALDICVKETGATLEEKAFNHLKCYRKKRPVHDLI